MGSPVGALGELPFDASDFMSSAFGASDFMASGAGAGAGVGAGAAAGGGVGAGAGAGAGFSPQAVKPTASIAAIRNERFMVFPLTESGYAVMTL